VEGGGGWLMERSEKRRREIREAARLRAIRWRERAKERDSVEVVQERRLRRNEVERARKKGLKEGLRKVRSRDGRVEKGLMSVRDMVVGVNRRREGRNILGEIVNGVERNDINVVQGVSSLEAVLPIASNTSFEKDKV